MLVLASGHRGGLMVSYQQAADFSAWRIERDARGVMTCTAEARRVHSFWIGRGPIDLVVEIGTARWRWADVSPTVDGSRVVVRLAGRPEKD